jgi:hypothetical protein
MKMIWLVVVLLIVPPFAFAVPLTMAPNPNPYTEKNADGSRTPLIRLIGKIPWPRIEFLLSELTQSCIIPHL